MWQMSKNIIVKVNKDICLGCGLCASIADKTFMMEEINGEFKSIVTEGPHDSPEKINEAKNSCPAGAIEAG